MFTLEQLKDEVRRLASESPDYIYKSVCVGDLCSYIDGQNNKGCIFGQAIKNLESNFDFTSYINSSITGLLEGLGLDDKSRWCRCVQMYQDRGRTWKSCITIADDKN